MYDFYPSFFVGTGDVEGVGAFVAIDADVTAVAEHGAAGVLSSKSTIHLKFFTDWLLMEGRQKVSNNWKRFSNHSEVRVGCCFLSFVQRRRLKRVSMKWRIMLLYVVWVSGCKGIKVLVSDAKQCGGMWYLLFGKQ